MGYDMRYLVEPEGQAERVRAASEAVEAANAERDSCKGEKGTWLGPGTDIDDPASWVGRSARYQAADEALRKAYEAQDDADASYFRLNIFGMGRYRRLMLVFGMAFDTADEHPEFPEAEQFGVTYDQISAVKYEEDESGLSEEQLAQIRKYIAAQAEVLSWHGDEDSPVIPVHKFCSNDSWIVTPSECAAAVAAWRDTCKQAGAGDEDAGRKVLIDAMDELQVEGDYWLKWIAYLEGAVNYGGIDVH